MRKVRGVAGGGAERVPGAGKGGFRKHSRRAEARGGGGGAGGYRGLRGGGEGVGDCASKLTLGWWLTDCDLLQQLRLLQTIKPVPCIQAVQFFVICQSQYTRETMATPMLAQPAWATPLTARNDCSGNV